MANFQEDAKKLHELIGGDENIQAVTHCATRMRFALKDPARAAVKEIEALPSVKGTFTQAGQFQVIIGNKVADFYQEFAKHTQIQASSKEDVKTAAESNQVWWQKLMTFLAEVFAPIIPAIIVGGLILGFRNILEGVGFQGLGQKVVDGVLQTNADGTPIWNTITDVSHGPG